MFCKMLNMYTIIFDMYMINIQCEDDNLPLVEREDGNAPVHA